MASLKVIQDDWSVNMSPVKGQTDWKPIVIGQEYELAAHAGGGTFSVKPDEGEEGKFVLVRGEKISPLSKPKSGKRVWLFSASALRNTSKPRGQKRSSSPGLTLLATEYLLSKRKRR